jgi:hypothetical protein
MTELGISLLNKKLEGKRDKWKGIEFAFLYKSLPITVAARSDA